MLSISWSRVSRQFKTVPFWLEAVRLQAKCFAALGFSFPSVKCYPDAALMAPEGCSKALSSDQIHRWSAKGMGLWGHSPAWGRCPGTGVSWPPEASLPSLLGLLAGRGRFPLNHLGWCQLTPVPSPPPKKEEQETDTWGLPQIMPINFLPLVWRQPWDQASFFLLRGRCS